MTGHRPYDPRVSEGTEELRDAGAVPDPWKDGPRWSDSPADPWADLPASSDPAPDMGSVAEPAATGSDAGERRACAWCATPAALDAKTCSSCGAALAQREAIGDLVIPGLTTVDPGLKDYAARPLHLSGPSPSHGVASGAVAAAAIGGPAGLVIVGGVAAVAAAEYLGAARLGPDGVPIERVGEASEAVRRAIEKLDRGEALPPAGSTTPRPELIATDPAGAEPATREETADGAD